MGISEDKAMLLSDWTPPPKVRAVFSLRPGLLENRLFSPPQMKPTSWHEHAPSSHLTAPSITNVLFQQLLLLMSSEKLSPQHVHEHFSCFDPECIEYSLIQGRKKVEEKIIIQGNKGHIVAKFIPAGALSLEGKF